MRGYWLEAHKVIHAFTSSEIAACEDMFNGDPSSDVISMANWKEATLIVAKNAGASGTAVVTVNACDDTTPSNTNAVPFRYRSSTTPDTVGSWNEATASGTTITAGADQVWEFHISDEDLKDSSGGVYEYVQFVLTEDVDSPVDGGAVVVLTSPRYAEDQNAPTVLT